VTEVHDGERRLLTDLGNSTSAAAVKPEEEDEQ
jgi:hypothetical protein